jgi:nucleoside-diphosphate-sugar epimerase
MISLQELAEIVKRYKPNALIKFLEGSDYFTVPAMSYQNISRAKEELGYEPKYQPREAVKDYMLSLGIPG